MHEFLDWDLFHPSSVVFDLNTNFLAYAVYFERPITLSLLQKVFLSLTLFRTSFMKLTCQVSSCGSFVKLPNGLPPVVFLAILLVLAMLIFLLSFGYLQEVNTTIFYDNKFSIREIDLDLLLKM